MTTSTRPAASRSPASRAPSARVDEAGRDDVGAERGEALLDLALIAEQPLVQAVELRPVGGQADAEEADARARARAAGAHGAPSGGATRLLARRAPALAMRVRARA